MLGVLNRKNIITDNIHRCYNHAQFSLFSWIIVILFNISVGESHASNVHTHTHIYIWKIYRDDTRLPKGHVKDSDITILNFKFKD